MPTSFYKLVVCLPRCRESKFSGVIVHVLFSIGRNKSTLPPGANPKIHQNISEVVPMLSKLYCGLV